MKRNVNIGKPRHARLHGCIAVAGALVAAALSFPAAASDESDIASWIRPVPSTAKMAEDGWYVWCGSLAKDDCGVYHLFYARWKKSLGFGSWMTSSEIAHATGPSPFGPWTHRDVALPPRGLEYWDGPCTHNPTVHRFGGKWYMYYTATTGDGVPAGKGYNWLHRNNQRIGVAVADSLDGPWTRFDKPLIDVSADDAAPDSLNVSNPAVALRPDGTYVMVYKATGKKRPLPRGGPVVHLVATSKSPTGPFRKIMKPQFTAGDSVFPAEDPFIWHDGGRFRAIVKDFGRHFTRRKGPALVLFESQDGLDWRLEDRPFVTGCKIGWADGRNEIVRRLERPQLYFEEGRPVALLAAAGLKGLKGSFNVQIPLDASAPHPTSAPPSGICVYPEDFKAGGWGLDVQFADIMGSAYLIAHGKGIRVLDAKAEVAVPEAGNWRVWVRSRKWVDGAGAFKVSVGGRTLERTFGVSQDVWAWEDGGTVSLEKGTTEIRLMDQDGFDGRCAGVVLSRGDAPPEGALGFSTRPIEDTVDCDFVVTGGGLPGCCAAVAAARRGLKVAILNDRPVLGGNASSEIRVWSGGEARYPLVKQLRGWFMNRDADATLSDAHRMRTVADETNVAVHVCTRAFGVEKDGARIASVLAFDWKRRRAIRFRAPLFCDATGDGWIGFWAGADWRMGREARSEHGEPRAPEKADGDTLGASLMWTSAQANTDVPFSAPWAEKWAQGVKAVEGEWFWEYGIKNDMIHEAEWIRDRMLLAIYGSFSRAKRNPRNARRVLNFLPFVLGKRESRRLLGDWIYSETDISGKREFEDAIASGSWQVDLHYPGRRKGVDFMSKHVAPGYGRYWIPYRSIYSRNVPNLFMAGRCFSCTHIGLGGPRVMNTLAQLGCAAGEAAALCRRSGVTPRGLYETGRVRELQRLLGGDFPGNPDPARAGWRYIDDEDSRVSFSGRWRADFCQNGEQFGDKVHKPTGNDGKALYPLPVEEAGRYRLHGKVNYEWNVERGSSTLVTVASGGERHEVKWNQTLNMGEWCDLGTFDLKPGATAEIDVSRSVGTVIADAFAVESAEEGSGGDNIPSETSGAMPSDTVLEKMEKRIESAAWNAWRKAHPAPFWLFGEDRARAVRNGIVPSHWFAAGSRAADGFCGKAQPGEFYPFQVCVVSEKPRRIRWRAETDLVVSRITPEECEVTGGVKPIWVMVDIPKDAGGRTLKGVVRVADAASGESASIPFEIAVRGDVLEDGGVADHWRLSRLKWLNSDVGREDTVTKPYAPVAVDAGSRTVRILGRDVVLGEDGLPAQIVSHFSGSNTRVCEEGLPLLARPVAFRDGLATEGSSFAFTELDQTRAAWRSVTVLQGGVKRIVEGSVDFAGAASFRIRHEGGRVVAASLELAMPADAARFVEGFGRTGGAFPEGRFEHRWNPALNRDAVWMGRVNGGLGVRFKGANYRRPLVNAYYAWRPLAMPEGWASGGGTVVVERRADVATVRAAGADAPDGAEWNFDIFITPFHTFDMGTRLRDRYCHVKQRRASFDAAEIASRGATVVNLHHNTVWNPYINYPFNGDGGPLLKKAVDAAHGAGLMLKIYYTTRELTQNMPEFFALKSLDGEVVLRRDAAVPGWPVTNVKGPHPWLVAHVGTDILPAWRETVRFPESYPPRLDLAVVTAPETRWDNFYLAGLDHLVREYGIDGLYIDDTALTGESMRRARRILDRDGRRRLIDNHSWNHHDPRAGGGSSNLVFLDLYPYFDSLWRGEGFSDGASADSWLVERSGFPFGVPSEMLGKGNPFKGLVFGMTSRWGWGGKPRGLWRFFDETGLDRMAFSGWWDDELPVRVSGADDVKASVWTGGGRAVLVLANFAKMPRRVSVAFDTAKLGFDGAKAKWMRPAIADVQEAAPAPDFSGAFELPAGGGFVAVADAGANGI